MHAKQILAPLVAAWLLIQSGVVLAVPILQGPTTAATGISGLEIAGTLYNVTFSNFGRFNARAENPPTFLGDQAGAKAAEEALVDLLNSAGVTGITNLGGGARWFLAIPYSLTATNFSAEAAILDLPRTAGTWRTSGTSGGRDSNYGNVSWVSFTAPAPAPEPGTLAIFAMGLLGLATARRRRS